MGLRGAVSTLAALVALVASPVVAADDGKPPPDAGHQPDPKPVPSKRQWLLSIQVRKGVVDIKKASLKELEAPVATARVMGRYAFELRVGNELLDRVRFNVPLTGDLPREDNRPFKNPTFAKVSTSFRVRIADQPRATYARLVDRATGEEQRFFWPPKKGVLKPWKATANQGDDTPPKNGPKKGPPKKPKPAPPKAPNASAGEDPSKAANGKEPANAPSKESPPEKEPAKAPQKAPPKDSPKKAPDGPSTKPAAPSP